MKNASDLSSGGLLARNVAINAAGGLLPALAALVAVPPLVHGLGDSRFGILTLAWATLGYFSLFDLGVGRAATHAIAHRLGDDQPRDIADVAWTALVVMVPIAVAGAVALAMMAPWLITNFLNVPDDIQAETILGLRILAIAIPFTAMNATLRGLLEAKQLFGWVNALRAPYGVVTFLGPVALLPFSHSLVPACLVLTSSRVVLTIANLAVCAKLVDGFGTGRPRRLLARGLIGFGGWMTVSNLVSPLMNTLDRFVVASFVTVGAVTYYATPHELATKMWLFTAAVLPVVFPAFVTSFVRSPERTARLYDRTLRITFGALFLPTFVLVVLAPEVLGVWLGGQFPEASAQILRVLTAAVFVNTIGQVALTLIQGLGRPDLTGKYHLIELPIYALCLWILLPRMGLEGVAVAWAIRAILDTALLLFTCPVLLKAADAPTRRVATWLVASAPVFIGLSLVPDSAVRVAVTIIAIPVWGFVAWRRLLTPEERALPLRALITGT